MSSGGFGPEGPGVSDAPPFAVAGPSELAVDASRAGLASLTVSNVIGRAVRARVLVMPGAGADAAWFSVVGSPERALPDAGTATVEVAVSVPPEAAAGSYTFVVGAALEESPDRVVWGSTVTFVVPELATRRFPWWIVIVAAVVVLALAGAGIWWLNRPGLPRSAERVEPPVLVTGSFEYTGFTFGIDPDTGTARPGSWEVSPDLTIWDLDSYGGLAEPMYVTAYVSGIQTALVDDGDFRSCRAARVAGLFGTVDIPVEDDADTAYICVITSEGRLALLEITARPGDPIVRDVVFTVWG